MHVYFSAIGGVGIGPLAMIALDLGYSVSGSDLQNSEMIDFLRDRGARIYIGQDASQIASEHAQKPIDWLVYSSALAPNHPELIFAREQGIKTSKRADFLNMVLKDEKLRLVAVAGTHGKTTTTGMLAWLYKELGLPVSYSVGTSLSFGPPAQYQKGSEFFIYECDEFDKNFLEFHPYMSLITAVDYDHPDTYPTKADYTAAFQSFVDQSKWVISWQSDSALFHSETRSNFSIVSKQDEQLALITLPGKHNRENAWQAMQAAHELTHQPLEKLAEIINRFPGTTRRFEKLAPNLYSDYAHHPVEIAATIAMAKELNPTVVCVYQPHQNIRQQQLLRSAGYKDCFKAAEMVYWLPTYLSREDPKLEIAAPGELMASTGKGTVSKFAEMDDRLWQKIEEHLQAGDLVLGMSAGDLDHWLRAKAAKINR